MTTPRHILIVEDEQPIATMLQDIFTRVGHRVTHAANGAEALTQIENNPPDLILLDVMMPTMSGREMLHRLKETHHEQIPVIVLTNNDDVEVIADMLGSGANDYVVKSDMSPESIINAVEHRLKNLPTD